jgi:chemotaxis protein methyltransferase WspC
MSLPQIIALLRHTVGLDVASVGISLIERAVKRRVQANELRNISQYVSLLESSEPELQCLFEAVIVPETFFFRYPESFSALHQIVREQFLFGTQKMRALSVPCSTGEEPYSIAMTLLNAGLAFENFQIDAIDISAHSLDAARLGLFGSNSFRGNEINFRNQFFKKTDAGYRVCDRVRQCVNFEHGNLLQERFRFGSGPYNFIFCRNLLIYFYSEAQGQALKNLMQLLTRDGLLFVGSAEAGLLTQHGFSSVKLPMAFAFRKNELVAFHSLSKLKQSKGWASARACRSEAHRKPNLKFSTKPLPETVKHGNSFVPDLAFAEQLADRGKLAEAAEICELSLHEQGPSARAFHLLGLIRDCAGDQHLASEFYRKALYLEPDRYDVLIHFALLKDKSGDSVAAKALKNRARRILERTK